jgi:hypothetical protein
MPSIGVVVEIQDDSGIAAAQQLAGSPLIGGVAVAGAFPATVHSSDKVQQLKVGGLRSRQSVVAALRWFEKSSATHLLWLLSTRCAINERGLQRVLQVAQDTNAALVYSDYYDCKADGTVAAHPLVDYQSGSIRDDFDFGHAVLLSRNVAKGVAEAMESDHVAGDFGGWYDLRLRVSERGDVARLPEPTYSVSAVAERNEGEAHFKYVDPRNRNYQVEMERIATAHLKRIGAWLSPPTGEPVAASAHFPVEASVVIPVRNRVRTVGEAVKSALSQQATFPFNVIVVDNESTDGTTQLLADLAASESRLVHVVPARNDLGIGGCWNEAAFSERCGRYAIQLDSDDLYSSSDVLQRIVDEFRTGQYAMVIGSYTIVNFNLEQIPPGLIDHREWTPENGHNNALRIAGLGAPRAFHVPTLRTLGLPNVSFGEDYAIALRLSRQYRIGRIYDSLYWCRRWEGNSDHALPLETQNRYAAYKDRLRSIEIAARQEQNKSS